MLVFTAKSKRRSAGACGTVNQSLTRPFLPNPFRIPLLTHESFQAMISSRIQLERSNQDGNRRLDPLALLSFAPPSVTVGLARDGWQSCPSCPQRVSIVIFHPSLHRLASQVAKAWTRMTNVLTVSGKWISPGRRLVSAGLHEMTRITATQADPYRICSLAYSTSPDRASLRPPSQITLHCDLSIRIQHTMQISEGCR